MRMLFLGEPNFIKAQSQLQLRRKLMLLLAALVSAGPCGIRREKLATMFWADRQDAQAKSSLRQSLTALRKFFEDVPDISVNADASMVRLVNKKGTIDVFDFEELTDFSKGTDLPTENLVQAATLYRGPFLDSVSFSQEVVEHLTIYREALHNRAIRLVEEMSQRPGIADATEKLAQILLAVDPLAEEAHRALIRIALMDRKINRARKQLETCRQILLTELNAEPEPATIQLLDEFDLEYDEIPARNAPPPLPHGSSEPHRSAAQHAETLVPQPFDKRPSIVVLPFVEMTAGANDFFADGVVDELTNCLARMREFFVLSRQSAYSYKDCNVDIRRVGSELGASFAVEGTLRRSQDKLRLNVQLVETATGTVKWNRSYEDSTSDLFDLQVNIAHQLAGAILPSVRNFEIERVSSLRPDNLDAYEIVLKAYPKFWIQDGTHNREAIDLFGQAIEKEPTYGHAMAMKAWCLAQQTCYLWSTDPAKERKLAVQLAHEAAKLIADDATAFAALSATYTMVTSDSKLAWHFAKTCLDIDPCNAWGWMRAGWLDVLSNEPRKGLESMDHAEALSPTDPLLFNVYFAKGIAWASLKEFDRAIEYIHKGMHAGPSVTWAYRVLASLYSQAGKHDQMLDAIAKFQNHYPNVTMRQIRESLPPAMVESNASYLNAMEAAGIPKS